MGKKGQTSTQTTEYPAPTPLELQLQSAAMELITNKILGDQFYVKKIKDVNYKNPGLVSSLGDEQKRYQSDVDRLNKELETLNARPQNPGFHGRRDPSLDPEYQRINRELSQAQTSLDDTNRRLGDEKGQSTSYERVVLLEKPPPKIRALINTLPFEQRGGLEDVLQNYGYNSKEFREIAGRTRIGRPAGTGI